MFVCGNRSQVLLEMPSSIRAKAFSRALWWNAQSLWTSVRESTGGDVRCRRRERRRTLSTSAAGGRLPWRRGLARWARWPASGRRFPPERWWRSSGLRSRWSPGCSSRSPSGFPRAWWSWSGRLCSERKPEEREARWSRESMQMRGRRPRAKLRDCYAKRGASKRICILISLSWMLCFLIAHICMLLLMHRRNPAS